MSWERTEFLLKGLYLGLLLLVALQGPSWLDLAKVGLFTLGGLALCLALAAYGKIREGYQVRGRLPGFILFLLLENPRLVYTGIIAGLTLGAYSVFREPPDQQEPWLILGPIVGGMALGLIFHQMQTVADRKQRNWLGLVLVAALVAGAVLLLRQRPDLLARDQRFMIGVLLLVGIPGFYLLTFSSLVEESEVEIAAIAAALGVSLCFLGEDISPNFGVVGLVVPLALYYVYTRKVLPGLRVFKHALRGMSYAKIGKVRPALLSFNRALQLNPQHKLTQAQLWELHRQMDFEALRNDPETLAQVNFDLCLDRAASLLLADRPGEPQIGEARRLLDLVEEHRPTLKAPAGYWRAVALCHAKDYEAAADQLRSVLEAPEQDDAQRRAILFQAWQLALFLHPEMRRRVGEPLIQRPDRRLEAIAAAERVLAGKPDDEAAWDLKRLLYSPLTEADYQAAPPGKARDFDHAYAEQLGLALVDQADQWRRGCEFLRIALRGQPQRAPLLFLQIAMTHDKHGDTPGRWENVRQALHSARGLGVKNLSAEDQLSLFTSAKLLGEQAMKDGDVDAALDAFKFYSQYEKAGLETYRNLAELFERKGDVFLALNCTEHALSWNGQDKDLLERKDRYTYSIQPADLKARLDQVGKWFDVDYCLTKARWILDKAGADPDNLDWAGHLTDLALVVQPKSIQAKLLRARVHRLRGDVEQAVAVLEDVRQNKPEKFGGEAEKEAWYLVHRLLGDLYVEEKPEQAVLCLTEFRNSDKAGADSMYKLGRAYENLGDAARAARCYENVTAYEGHPLYWDAKEGLDRVRQTAR